MELNMSVFDKIFKNEKNYETNNLHSRYWMGNDVDVFQSKKINIIELAQYRRAVANFVRIVTDENINVKFNIKDLSMTDKNKNVIISADTDNKHFDATIGLALHEGSHIVKSDLRLPEKIIGKNIDDGGNEYKISDKKHINSEILKKAKKINVNENTIRITIKDIWNWIEDRRIDKWQYDKAPGYQPYYKALYNKYFNSKIVDEGLKSNSKRSELIDSYIFRFINLINPSSNINALKGLREMSEKLDINNINRLNNSEDAYTLAMELFNIMLKYLVKHPTQKKESNKNKNGDNYTISSDGDLPNDMVNINGQHLNKKDLKKLEDAIKKQKNFINGITDKKEITKSESKKLNAIEEAGTTFEKLGKASNKLNTKTKIDMRPDIMVVRKINKTILTTIPIGYDGIQHGNEYNDSKRALIEGSKLGRLLASKLQVRNETRTTEYNRKYTGKIDKRMIAGIGYGSESICKKIVIDKFGDALIHISIDASGSMSGNAWYQTMVATIALCKAIDMIENIDVVVSMRTTIDVNKEQMPIMVIVYDSKKDKFAHVRKYFPFLCPSNMTPEGICFEVIMKDILESMNSCEQKIFINFSDGMPNVGNKKYINIDVYQLTRRAVNKLRANGIEVLSFLLQNGWGGNKETFQKMYGRDARTIDITNVRKLAFEFNKKFLEK